MFPEMGRLAVTSTGSLGKPYMSYVGVIIGALTVKVAALQGDSRHAAVVARQGCPLEVLQEILARPEFADAEYLGVSG
jgi:hypothetical protein